MNQANLSAADFYESEADLRDELASIARAAGWLVKTEQTVKAGATTWGRIDLACFYRTNRTRGRLKIIECKLRIRGISQLRQAVAQVYTYKSMLGMASQAFVTAAELPENVDRQAIHGMFGVGVVPLGAMADLLRKPDGEALMPYEDDLEDENPKVDEPMVRDYAVPVGSTPTTWYHPE